MRPAVLIIDSQPERRQALSDGLSEWAYEVVAATNREEGLRFAQGLGSSVIVAEEKLLPVAGGLDRDLLGAGNGGVDRALLLLANGKRPTVNGNGANGHNGSGELAKRIFEIPAKEMDQDRLLRSLHLLLVARELGLEVENGFRCLSGEIENLSVLDLVRSLSHLGTSGGVRFDDGAITLEGGEVTAAWTGRVRGSKAFYRLGQQKEGVFRVFLGDSGGEREIRLPLEELVLGTLEEAQVEWPHPKTRIRRLAGRSKRAGLSPEQTTLLELVERWPTVGGLLDAVPTPDGLVIQALEKLQDNGLIRLVPPRIGVAIVTDSSADLPPELVEDLGIHVVPQTVRFGEAVFRDGTELDLRSFYGLLKGQLDPLTEPVREDDLSDRFDGLLQDKDVVAIHQSGGLSETVALARQAALNGLRGSYLTDHQGDFALEVLDSQSVSLGLGLQVLFAARMAQRGQTVFAITQFLRCLLGRLHVLFLVENPEAVARNQALGAGQGWAGKLLGKRPILEFQGGQLTVVDEAKAGRHGTQRLLELLSSRVDDTRPVVGAVAHARAAKEAGELREQLRDSFQMLETVVSDIGPTMIVQAGPGCIGAAVFQPTDEEWELIAPIPAP